MKKILNFCLSLVICLFLLGQVIQTTGTNINNKKVSVTILHERFITIPNSTILLRLWDTQLDSNQMLPFYSISLDEGRTYIRTIQPSYELGFRYSHFDPLNGEPDVEPMVAAGLDTHLFIVQFFTQPLKEFKEAITSIGGVVHHYIAQYAYLVEMNDTIREQIQFLPYVRWVGPYHPAFRLEEFMVDNIDNAYQTYPLQRYNIQVLSVEQKPYVAEHIKLIGGIVNNADAGKFLVEATLSTDQLFSVIRWDEVLFVDRWSAYEADMDIARGIGGANYIESIAGYNGSDVRGEVFDIGFNLLHIDFQSRPLILHGNVGSDSHGASTSGIVFGDGTGNPQARGMLPEGQGIVGDCNYIGLEGTNRYIHTGELLQDPYYGVFETSSVGSDRTTQYTTISADTDTALFDFDILHCQSQSNAGDQMSRPQAWAKNIVSGGGVYHYNTLAKTDDQWNYGASIGPASDGRIKPDLCHFYDDIFTTTSGSPTAYTSSFGGTSGATPIIAGHFGLFYQMWSDGIFGNEVNPEGTVFENRPHMTTAKAMLINTADQYPFNGTTCDKTRMHQGWGMPNVQNIYDLRDNFYIIDESDILDPFEISTHLVSVVAGSPSLKVTMTYADPAGNPAVQTQHRINDLSLKVISPSHVIYWGNYGLTGAIWSLPEGTPDTKDTVECVFLQNPEPGIWTIEISADELIQDSHVETPELDSDYALVVSPVVSSPLPPQINGPSSGSIGKETEFSFMTTDPGNATVFYYIDWGDGNTTMWLGPYPSGEQVTVKHTWYSKGNFSITSKAKNSMNLESGWSDPFLITIYPPRLEIGEISGGLFKIKAVIKNTGFGDAISVNWSITFNGGIIFGNKQINGSILKIPAGGQISIASKMLMGFGKTVINILVTTFDSSTVKTQNATIFFFFIKL